MELPDGFVPQLIALDIDDTLIEHDGPVHESAVEAIARVQAMGIMVVASTGRSRSTTTPVCRAAGIREWAVCSNGALLVSVEPEGIVESVSFDPTDLLIRVVDATGRPPVLRDLSATVGRPTHRRADVTPPLQAEGGVYRAKLALEPGNWTVTVTALSPDGTAFRQKLTHHIPDRTN